MGKSRSPFQKTENSRDGHAAHGKFGSVKFNSCWTCLGSVFLVLCLVLVLDPHQQDNLNSKLCHFSSVSGSEASVIKSMTDVVISTSPKHTRRRTFTTLRIPHNTGANSSFQRHLKSRDIHPNPGPAKGKAVKYPCGECLCNV